MKNKFIIIIFFSFLMSSCFQNKEQGTKDTLDETTKLIEEIKDAKNEMEDLKNDSSNNYSYHKTDSIDYELSEDLLKAYDSNN